jgi:cysteine synthase
MKLASSFVDVVGNTPLIRLRRASEATGCEIYGKAEFMNPGGSVKDRAARGIVLDAERRGVLPPGGTVVEGTAGNTGIGLAHVCNARGYKCVIVMPDNQSPEKYALIEALGAEVRRVKTVPYSDNNHYQKIAGRLADEQPVRQRSQPARACGEHGPGNMVPDRRQDRCFCIRQRYWWHAGRRVRVPEVTQYPGAHRTGRSAGQCPV